MDRERQVLSAVELALEQPPATRPLWLAEQIGHDRVALAEATSIIGYQTRTAVLHTTRTMRGFAAGDMLDRFRIVRLLGSGGMGDVYEAEDTAHSEGRRRVALKTIRADFGSDQNIADQFKQEIGLGQAITHPNVCRIYDLGLYSPREASGQSEGPILFLTMELLRGRTLAQRLHEDGPMTPADALAIIRQVADALTAAHERNVVHRDLKPGNIMLVPSAKSDTPRAVVMDFGLAIEISAADGAANLKSRSGTPDYMSPEQVVCEPVGCASDIYSLGIVTYEMITGRFPFEGKTSNYRMVERLHTPPIPPSACCPELVPDWSPQILRALELDVNKRYETAESFAKALSQEGVANDIANKVVNNPGLLALPEPPVAAPTRTRARRWTAAAVLLSGLACASWFGRKQISNWLHPLPQERRIVVLPFENIRNDEAERPFTDGLMQTLVSQLTELEPLQGSLSIVPANEVRKLKVTTAQEASMTFGATLAITGSVERSPRGIHMIINLVDARHVKQLRSQDFFINPDDPAEMQEMVVRRVADIVQLELQPRTVERLARSAPASPAAYDFYLRGTGYLTQRSGEDSAIAEFKLALGADPNYVLAHAGLCEAYWQKYVDTKEQSWITPARQECDQAIHLNPGLARPHVSMAILNTGTGKYEEAVRQSKAALQIDPGSDQAHIELAKALDALGQKQEAEVTLKRAISLRPGNGLNYATLARFYYKHARYKDAEDPYKRLIELMPDNPAGYTNLGGLYLEEGNNTEAEKVLKRSMYIQPTYQAESNLGFVYFLEGKYAESVPMFAQAAQTNPKDYMVWGNLADAYRWTPGKAAEALAAYRKAIELTQESLNVNPKDAKALSDQALYRAKSGDLPGGLQASAKALAFAPGNPNFLFNAAVISEIAKQRGAALQYLGQAIKAGYSLREVETDPELAGLRRDKRYSGELK